MFTITKFTKYSPLHFMEMILFFISKGQDRIVCHIEYKTAKRGSKRLEMKNYSTIIVSIAFGHRPPKKKAAVAFFFAVFVTSIFKSSNLVACADVAWIKFECQNGQGPICAVDFWTRVSITCHR